MNLKVWLRISEAKTKNMILLKAHFWRFALPSIEDSTKSL